MKPIVTLRGDDGSVSEVRVLPPNCSFRDHSTLELPELLITQIEGNGVLAEDKYDVWDTRVWQSIIQTATRMDVEVSYED